MVFIVLSLISLIGTYRSEDKILSKEEYEHLKTSRYVAYIAHDGDTDYIKQIYDAKIYSRPENVTVHLIHNYDGFGVMNSTEIKIEEK